MGLPVIALAKLNLMLLSSRSAITPALAIFVGPFLLKLSLGYVRLVRGSYSEFAIAVRLFVFQLGQVIDRTVAGQRGGRWQRAFRLVARRISDASGSRGPAIDVEDSLHTLSMLAL
ncbi:hypothetical protein SAY87_031899 [Trapa incisa]|uniref:Uncharacterized protein n=2 Tax=Trapa TaxID=22665 RepID=A0AAN7RBW7_TRANT|nr:hypothetical protein SAY87_031899 [Trapa incisa]KAK4795770.1 hypothetical protein SAY86_028096 [Trapa natans]